MGNKQSKEPLIKTDKTVDDEKLLKIGLGLGRGDLRVEGNFQMGWHRRCNKSYRHPTSKDTQPLIQPGDDEEEEVGIVNP